MRWRQNDARAIAERKGKCVTGTHLLHGGRTMARAIGRDLHGAGTHDGCSGGFGFITPGDGPAFTGRFAPGERRAGGRLPWATTQARSPITQPASF